MKYLNLDRKLNFKNFQRSAIQRRILLSNCHPASVREKRHSGMLLFPIYNVFFILCRFFKILEIEFNSKSSFECRLLLLRGRAKGRARYKWWPEVRNFHKKNDWFSILIIGNFTDSQLTAWPVSFFEKFEKVSMTGKITKSPPLFHIKIRAWAGI